MRRQSFLSLFPVPVVFPLTNSKLARLAYAIIADAFHIFIFHFYLIFIIQIDV